MKDSVLYISHAAMQPPKEFCVCVSNVQSVKYSLHSMSYIMPIEDVKRALLLKGHVGCAVVVVVAVDFTPVPVPPLSWPDPVGI